MKTLIRALRALENHWLGDVVAGACLFGMLWLVLVAGAVLG